MKQLNVQVAAKRIENQWEAAVISDGKFSRALKGNNLWKLVSDQLTALLSFDRVEGTEIAINVSIIDGPPSDPNGENNDGAQ